MTNPTRDHRNAAGEAKEKGGREREWKYIANENSEGERERD